MATKHAATRAAQPCELGFSLLEAAVVVAIVAIVGASALPSFSALIDARRLGSAATASSVARAPAAYASSRSASVSPSVR